ncbi:hypothetical protein VTK73DRAFT_2491 [Phialemonium thermophilum]|uniref:Uncharacterized protein n=1 Tax=Phialemonium thermophilum TaxID=223376 RepID=A0ABR3Y2G1_9PEZI
MDHSTSPSGSGIRVERVVSVTSSEPRDEPSPRQTRIPAQQSPDSNMPERPKAFRKTSDSSSILSDIFRHPELGDEKIQKKINDDKRSKSGSPKDLIDFLRNTTPPPQNYMSRLDDCTLPSSSSEKEKRSSLWLFGKRKRSVRRSKRKQDQKPKRPITIKLPDSAVAGTTIDGHRYIAIAIPSQYDYQLPKEPADLDNIPSKDEVAPSRLQVNHEPCPSTADACRSSPRVFTSDRGIVTVLKPVAEARESTENARRSPHSSHDNHQDHPLSAVSPPNTETTTRAGIESPDEGQKQTGAEEPSTSPSSKGGGKPSISWKQTGSAHPRHHRRQKSSTSSSASGLAVPAYTAISPGRRSSSGVLSTSTSAGSSSLDDVLLGPAAQRRKLSSDSSTGVRRGSGSGSGSRASISESIVTNGTEPVIVSATAAHVYAPLGVAASVQGDEDDSADPGREGTVEETCNTRRRATTNPETFLFAPVTEMWRNPWSVPGVTTTDTPGRTAAGGESWQARSRATTLPTRPVALDKDINVASARTDQERGLLDVELYGETRGQTLRSRLSTTPIIVVADIQPTAPFLTSIPVESSGLSVSSLASTESREHQQLASETADPRADAHGSRHSSGGTALGPFKVASLDRISLARRREREIERERARAEAAEDEARRLRKELGELEGQLEGSASPPYLKQQAAAVNTSRTTSSFRSGARTEVISTTTPQNLQQQCAHLQQPSSSASHDMHLLGREKPPDATRDSDIESRLGRLERLGDSWLGTLVPLLESINHHLELIRESQSNVVPATNSWDSAVGQLPPYGPSEARPFHLRRSRRPWSTTGFESPPWWQQEYGTGFDQGETLAQLAEPGSGWNTAEFRDQRDDPRYRRGFGEWERSQREREETHTRGPGPGSARSLTTSETAATPRITQHAELLTGDSKPKTPQSRDNCSSHGTPVVPVTERDAVEDQSLLGSNSDIGDPNIYPEDDNRTGFDRTRHVSLPTRDRGLQPVPLSTSDSPKPSFEELRWRQNMIERETEAALGMHCRKSRLPGPTGSVANRDRTPACEGNAPELR